MSDVVASVPVLDVKQVSVSLGGRSILDHVRFAVHRGEFTGLIGSNGAGKTTLLRSILGLQRLNAGEIRVEGEPLSRHNRALGYVPQKVLLDPDIPMRARDFVALGLDAQPLRFLDGGRKRNVSGSNRFSTTWTPCDLRTVAWGVSRAASSSAS